MEHYLKITVCLLLIVQTCLLASLPESTDSPGRTIDKGWLRGVHKMKDKGGIKKAPVATDEPGYESVPFTEALDSNNVEADEIPSGFMMFGDENRSSGESSENKTSGNPPLPPQFSNYTDEKPQVSNTTAAPTTTTTIPSNSSQTNMTGAEEDPHNSTMTNQTSTGHSSHHNHTSHNRTHLHTTTLAPEKNKGLDNSTGSNGTTTATTTATPGSNETSLTSSSTTAFPSETTGADPMPMTPLAPITPEEANITDKDGASGSGADRVLASDPHKSRRHGAWAAILGTAVAVAIVGLVAYVILKKKHQMGFSHRKLVEVYPSDPEMS
ncbi:mucin-15 isoform X2 [Platichthys flesus]|uniref:mucin-15 isoform X2 n=1 Tax=Platichthys flesus TaxID=8260 RepID=UPI002DBE6941|nr:mucin-15 isoform X2 [Platichthys flesus]